MDPFVIAKLHDTRSKANTSARQLPKIERGGALRIPMSLAGPAAARMN